MTFIMLFSDTTSFIEQFSLDVSVLTVFFILVCLHPEYPRLLEFVRKSFAPDETHPGQGEPVCPDENLLEEVIEKKSELSIEELKPKERSISSLDELD